MEDESRTQPDEDEVEAHRRDNRADNEDPEGAAAHEEDEVEGHRWPREGPSEPEKLQN